MLDINKNDIHNKVVKHKTKLYLLAQKLNDVADELEELSDEEKKVVIERADKKNSWT